MEDVTLVVSDGVYFLPLGKGTRDFRCLLLSKGLRTRVMNDNLKILLWDR